MCMHIYCVPRGVITQRIRMDVLKKTVINSGMQPYLNYLHWSYCDSFVIFNCSYLCQSVCRWILRIPYAAFFILLTKIDLFALSTNVINGMCKGTQFLYLRYCIEGLITPHHSLCSILITLTNQIDTCATEMYFESFDILI